MVDFLQFSVQRGIDLNDLWVADRDGRVAWAVLPIVSPGRTMLLLAPPGERLRAAAADAGEETAAALLDAACDHFAQRGVLLAQALLDPSDHAAAQLYLARSFRQMAELLYLQADVRRAAPAPPLPDGFDWVTYAPETHDAFVSTIVQSYRESLDCPGLNGLRDMDDVIAGHKASGGEFDPSWWFLLREGGEPRAVLLLARAAQPNTTELVYLGLVPGARGRGMSDLVMRQALHVVAASSNERATLALAVDAHNVPALRLYHRHGMRRIGSKLALMRDLRPEGRARDGANELSTNPDARDATDALI